MDFITPPNVDNPDDTMALIPISQCEEANYPKNQEGSVAIGQFLYMKHISASAAGQPGTLVSSAKWGSTNGRNGLRQNLGRPGTSKPYDRILFFADLEDTNGQCFAVILKDGTTSRAFFHHALQYKSPSVGGIYLLEEPAPVENYLGTTNSVPVITGCSRFLPLEMPCHAHIPECPMTVPSIGNTQYFAYRNVQVTFSMVHLVATQCNGNTCDHQQLSTGSVQKCGCFHQNQRARATLSFNVELSIPDPVSNESTLLVSGASSRRTSDLFLHTDSWNHVMPTDWTQVRKVREQVAELQTVVNRNGGWTIVGWLRTGTVNDVSAGAETENLASINQKPHISYLYPTDPEVVNLPDFQEGILDLRPVAVSHAAAEEEDGTEESLEEDEQDGEDEEENVEESDANSDGSSEEEDNNDDDDSSDTAPVPPPHRRNAGPRGPLPHGRGRGRRGAHAGRGPVPGGRDAGRRSGAARRNGNPNPAGRARGPIAGRGGGRGGRGRV